MIQKAMHDCLRPKSVGPNADTDAVLRWRARQQQLWRWTIYESETIAITPIKVGGYRGEHSSPPRKGDKVLVHGKFGVILYINHSDREAYVRTFDKGSFEDDMFDLDLFETNPGSRTLWRILG